MIYDTDLLCTTVDVIHHISTSFTKNILFKIVLIQFSYEAYSKMLELEYHKVAYHSPTGTGK
jgi:hypothetical protein